MIYKVIRNYVVQRWAGYLFFLLIILASFLYALRTELSSYLRNGITWSLYVLGLLVFAPVFASLIKEFDDMFRSVGRSIKARWLLVIPYDLKIAEKDSQEVIKKKVSRYVRREVAKQDQNFELWQGTLRGKQPNARLRPLWLMFAGLIAFCILWWSFTVSTKSLPEWLDPSKPGLATLITIGIGLPVAYMVWLFRDQNNLWQIENSRKDINLKDFQRLSELACGAHYPEQKEGDKSYAQRKQAAQAQQVSAIYQLQAFMEGAYGAQFTRPTFLLLKSVWGSLVEKDQARWDEWVNELPELKKPSTWELDKYLYWLIKGEAANKEYSIQFGLPVGKALQEVIAGEGGYRLRFNTVDTQASLFAGLNGKLAGMKPLQMAGCKFKDIRWQGADLSNSFLQGTSLVSAQLQGSKFNSAELHGSILAMANFQGANLDFAYLQAASLFKTNLQGARMWFSRLQGADLRFAILNGTDLSGACMQGANLRGCYFDECTRLTNCQINSHTKFGRLKEGASEWISKDHDWIDEDAVRQEWINRGAVMV